ncbi:autophagy-related protein 27 [Sparassis latifolia]|uniref:Uncharacterized protein n=1 Tax=Sparassis crispa TaxID=139825 RepID=A0A401GG60_9APHY|nr:hypothetical protein SCP_0308780 [Sparassis crispa]GBE81152.1 hypothetical protein SCP_0308780 [Sparassis crispa]
MILRRTIRVFAYTLLQLFSLVSAQDDGSPFDCHITSGNLKYDLTALAGEHTVSRTRMSPPTEMIDSVAFNLCADLQQKDGVGAQDQCPSGTRACLTKTNRKEGEADRIFAVIPLAKSSTTDMAYTSLTSPQGLCVTFRGPSYPDPTSNDLIPQTFNLKLLCNPEDSGPSFVSYNRSDMSVEWSAPAGCLLGSSPDAPSEDLPGGDDGSGDDKKQKSVGSGVGYFFLLLFLSFAAYFTLGAYYNYSTYGATGMDLIPHRDFWREVPYMLRDVVSHLCSSVRSRQSASRGGYIAV